MDATIFSTSSLYSWLASIVWTFITFSCAIARFTNSIQRYVRRCALFSMHFSWFVAVINIASHRLWRIITWIFNQLGCQLVHFYEVNRCFSLIGLTGIMKLLNTSFTVPLPRFSSSTASSKSLWSLTFNRQSTRFFYALFSKMTFVGPDYLVKLNAQLCISSDSHRKNPPFQEKIFLKLAITYFPFIPKWAN